MNREDENTITIGFAGDVMIGCLANEEISKAGCKYPWGNVLPVLLNTDPFGLIRATLILRSEQFLSLLLLIPVLF